MRHFCHFQPMCQCHFNKAEKTMSLTPKKTNGASQMTKHIMKLMVKYKTWVVLRKRSILQEVLKNIRYAEKIFASPFCLRSMAWACMKMHPEALKMSLNGVIKGEPSHLLQLSNEETWVSENLSCFPAPHFSKKII